MFRTKTILGTLLAFTVVVVQVLSAAAAPAAQASTVDGTIQSCSTATDPLTGAIIVVCSVNLTAGGTQTVRLSAADAQTLGLATINADGSVTITATIGQVVSIDTSSLLSDPCALPSDASQPVETGLTRVFCGSLGLDYTAFDTLHSQGFGFGEIAQACFMAQALNGDGALCQAILTAKQTGDYSGLTLHGGATVSNWGQLRKLVFANATKNMLNLGAVMSGRASGTGNGNGHGKNNSNGHGNGNGNGNSNPHANGH
jgi:hypothetical protein